MTIVHTVSQAFIVKEDYDAICKMWADDDDVRFMVVTKMTRAATSLDVAAWAPITIDCDMIVAVQEGDK